jgi:hypothetical protein
MRLSDRARPTQPHMVTPARVISSGTETPVVSRSSHLAGKSVELVVPGLNFITQQIVPARGRFTAAPFDSQFRYTGGPPSGAEG